MVHEKSEDSDHLYTPHGSDDNDEGMKYPTYKSCEGMKFQLGMMFINKEVTRDVVKDYGMENHNNVFIKNNVSKRVAFKLTDGCNLYMRSKHNGGVIHGMVIMTYQYLGSPMTLILIAWI